SSDPSATTLRTWRWVTNQSNQPGNRVKMSSRIARRSLDGSGGRPLHCQQCRNLCNDDVRCTLDPLPRESQHLLPADLQIGVSLEVALSLRPRAMVGVGVDLDHEPRLRPVEVDLVAVQHRVDERLGKAVSQTEAQEGGL